MNAPIIKSYHKLIHFFSNLGNKNSFELDCSSQVSNNEKDEVYFKLLKSLKQLEFVSYFEMQIQNNNEENYSLEFLQKLDLMKEESKLNAMDLIINSAA